MKIMERFQATLTLCAVGVGVAFYFQCPLAYWGSILDGLLVFLGLVVASLVQVVPVTANFLQAETLSSKRIRSLQEALDRQQNFWLGLLALSVLTAVLMVVAKFQLPSLTQHLATTPLGDTGSKVISGLLGFFNVLIVVKFFGIIPGIKSLQRIRFQLALEQAEERERKARRRRAKIWPKGEAKLKLPPGFGRARTLEELSMRDGSEDGTEE